MMIATIADPLANSYFTVAAHNLNAHHVGPGHDCAACGDAWPCTKAPAAAMVLDLHATDPAAA